MVRGFSTGVDGYYPTVNLLVALCNLLVIEFTDGALSRCQDVYHSNIKPE